MSGSTRHAACTACRERKIRCDGGQPCCQKCKRRGSECVYVRSGAHDKGDLLLIFKTLHERLCSS
ncbi:hypothetical protein BGZ60DRAFT_392479 [Tricladium varicosporioides]|nr:hypothetical protein BGZ60DRAFT_392479 [Hymenoscyphus varicosporioides]